MDANLAGAPRPDEGSLARAGRQGAIRRELAKVMAQHGAMPRAEGPLKAPEAESAAKPRAAIAAAAPSGHRGAADGPLRTPEAIRSSRRLRQSHEVLLAGLDAKEDAVGMVSQRLVALRQRRRELARALEHLEVVATAAAPPMPHPALATCELAAGSEPAATAGAEMAAYPLEDAHRTEDQQAVSADDAAPNDSRVLTESSNASLCSRSESVQAGEEDAMNTSMHPASFDVLVQSLLRASLSDKRSQHDGMETDAGIHTYPVSKHESLVQTDAMTAIHSAVHAGVGLPSSCNAGAARLPGSDSVKRLESEDPSLAELLRSESHVTGLLRPQDLKIRRCSARDDTDAGSALQLQHARLCAAAALERAHELDMQEEAGSAGVLPQQTYPELLPPLALALAATLRQSTSEMLGGDFVACGNSREGAHDHEPWCETSCSIVYCCPHALLRLDLRALLVPRPRNCMYVCMYTHRHTHTHTHTHTRTHARAHTHTLSSTCYVSALPGALAVRLEHFG